MIIDFHTHVFPPSVAQKAIPQLEAAARMKAHPDGTPDGLIRSMASAGVAYSVTLPVATNPRQPARLNPAVAETNQTTGQTGLIAFGAMHPDDPDWAAQLDFLASHGVKGIKLHPMYQQVDLDDLRSLRIIAAAAERDLIVLVHAGEDIGIPGQARCTPRQVLRVLKETGIPKLVLAHMGGWNLWEQVKAELTGAPVYFDTSFSFGSVRFHPDYPRTPQECALGSTQLLASIILAHGADRILFGSDSPWGDQAEQLAILRNLGLSPRDLEAILGGNAARLLDLYGAGTQKAKNV